MRKNHSATLIFAFVFMLFAWLLGTVGAPEIALAAQPAYTSEESSIATAPIRQTMELTFTVWMPLIIGSGEGISTSNDIILEGDSITYNGDGAIIDGTVVTITDAGTYNVIGTLYDGQIVVDSEDEEPIEMIWKGIDITCTTSAPVFVSSADEVVITLADGTENFVTDGDTYVYPDPAEDEPDAAIFSKDDLVINGNGALTVNANYNNGIAGKDDLEIAGPNITVNAVNDGVKGKDSITVESGTFNITTGGDGFKSNNDEDPEKGYVAITNGTFAITAGADGIQAETGLIISGGDFTMTTGGGSSIVAEDSAKGLKAGVYMTITTGTFDINSADDAIQSDGSLLIEGGSFELTAATDAIQAATTLNVQNGDYTMTTGGGSGVVTEDSAKGLKAGVHLTVTNGTFGISSADDSIHSDASLTIEAGTFDLATTDDAIHGETDLIINGGDINISECYEGIESVTIVINDGNIHLTSSDDGINVAGDVTDPGDYYLTINGGYIVVDAAGDGIDVNGAITMNDGVVLINGPTVQMNGAIDYDRGFAMNGGLLIGAGSSGMAQAPSNTSTQYAVLMNFQSTQPGGTMFHVERGDGQEILTFVPSKTYQSVVFSTPDLQNGASYAIYTGGSSTGAVTDGLYTGGEYTPGTHVEDFTINSTITTIGGGTPPGP